jgi:hypothetical protein
MTAPCPECARLRALISQALKVIRRSAGATTCPYCNEILELGAIKKAAVAHCYTANKSCGVKQWGSAATRFNYADPRDREEKPTHIVQTDPVAEAA